MNKETRLFIWGLFMFIIGAIDICLALIRIVEDTQTFWTGMLLTIGIICSFIGGYNISESFLDD